MNVKKLRQANKGITLIALVVTIVILLILAGITINLVFSDNGIIKKAQEAGNKTQEAVKNEQAQMNELADYIGNMLNGIGGGSTPEEQKLPSDGSYSDKKGVNTPDIENGALTPIVWDKTANSGQGAWVQTTGDDVNWYSYITTEKKWANAVIGGTFNEDGTLDESATGYAMFVWIPRFAYQISDGYHQSGADINPDDGANGANSAGTINIQFMKDTGYESATDETKTEESDWDNASGAGNWNIHPAFEYNGTKSGMWVAKFEASHIGCTEEVSTGETDTNITELTLQVKPGVTSWRNITISNIFDVCKNYRADLNSHMMKNSEWGAVAYLAQSIYGKNEKIWINNSSSYITGSAGESANAETDVGTTNDYTTKQGQEASTTGNVYGIYDMSGGAWEYVAAYLNNENENLTIYGNNIIASTTPDYFKDVYNVSSSGDIEFENYNTTANIYGDAIYETSLLVKNIDGASNNSWYSNYTDFPDNQWTFFIRGHNSYDLSSNGIFAFSNYSGDIDRECSFRPILISH